MATPIPGGDYLRRRSRPRTASFDRSRRGAGSGNFDDVRLFDPESVGDGRTGLREQLAWYDDDRLLLAAILLISRLLHPEDVGYVSLAFHPF